MTRRRIIDHTFFVALLLAAGLVLLGCVPSDQPGSNTDPGAALAAAGGVLIDFFLSFGRNILAAFIL